jgi:hypothetical protein
VSMDEIENEDAVALPDKEVMSLLDVNANVDLGLDLAAPVDLAAAANLNVAAPIEASAAANVLSPDGQAVGLAQQHGTIDQTISGKAEATAPQHAVVTQNSNPTEAGGTSGAPADAGAGAGQAAAPAAGAVGDAAGATGGAVGGVTGAAGGVTGAAGGAVGGATGGVDSLLSGGSLLDANVDIHANANLAAPVDGALAANGNVAAPIDAAVGANIGSDHGIAEAAAPQEVDIHQSLDNVSAEATAQQDSSVNQQ